MLVSTKTNQRLKHELSFNVMVLNCFTKVQHSFQFYSIFSLCLEFYTSCNNSATLFLMCETLQHCLLLIVTLFVVYQLNHRC